MIPARTTVSPLRRPTPSGAWLAVAATLAATGAALQASEPMYQPPQALPGGLDPRPYLYPAVKSGTNATVKFQGIVPPFQLQGAATLGGTTTWQNLGAAVPASGSVTVPIPPEGNGFVRVLSPDPNYVGSSSCAFCHSEMHAKWNMTGHAHALTTLKNIRQDKNAYCLPCHTVGYGLPNGYKDEFSTPQLAGVGCENCHGPAGNHIGNPFVYKPVITIAAETCGGCHTDAHHPTYDEWLDAGHSKQSEDFAFSGSGSNRMASCGVCHSGGARMAVVAGAEAGTTNYVFNGEDADNFAITCAVCHDPHETFTNVVNGIQTQPAQIRHPVASTKFYSYYTATNFTAQYDQGVQLCAQCHNQRGALWTGTGRPPHHSPQYNILVGKVADPNGTNAGWNGLAMGHGDPVDNPTQCTTCHNRAEEAEGAIGPTNPNYTGHRFEVELKACGDCHGFEDEAIAEYGVEFIQGMTHENMTKVINALNTWAATKIPNTPTNAPFFATNVVPWETTTAGQLNPGKVGPSTAGQNRTPTAIKQARFLLYLVEHDASYGVHNVGYVQDLLQEALKLTTNAPAVPPQ